MTIFVNKFLLFVSIVLLLINFVRFYINMEGKRKEINRIRKKLKEEQQSGKWDNF